MSDSVWYKKVLWFLGAATCAVAYTNCGEGFQIQDLSSTVGGSRFYQAPGETCEAALVRVYKSTYQPFLIQHCGACHVQGGGGNGLFAEADVSTSYTSFASKGMNLINAQATGFHKPPFTGSQHQNQIAQLSSIWSGSQSDYAHCLASEGGGGGGAILKTAAVKVPAKLTTTFRRIEWDLEKDSTRNLPMIAGIDVRRMVLNNETRGYEFRNATLKLKPSASKMYRARALHIYINDELQTNITTYTNIDVLVSSTTDINFAAGFANGTVVRTPSDDDMIALEFSSVTVDAALPQPSPSPSPTPTPSPSPSPSPSPTPTVVTYSSLVATGGVFAMHCVSCHTEGGPQSAGLNLKSYAAAKASADAIKRRMNDVARPMPASGILPESKRSLVEAWINQGMPQ